MPDLDRSIRQGYYQALAGKVQGADLPGMIEPLNNLPLAC